jgi:hypothetical protein
MESTVERMVSLLTPTNEKKQIATPTRTTKSNIKIDRIIETSKFMLHRSEIVSEKGISAPKNTKSK